MQKKLIAAAVASLAAAPFALAQSNVTVYGIADAGYAHTSASGRNNNVIAGGNINGNRLGFRGTEDVGGGLKAIFTFEMGYNIDTGAAAGGLNINRQSWVGLRGNFGSVSVGKQYSPGYYVFLYDTEIPLTLSPAFVLNSKLNVGNVSATAPNSRLFAGGPARTDNSIVYDTPVFGGFSAKLIYGFGEVANDVSQGRTGAVGVNYTQGPFGVGYVYSSYEMKAAEASDGLTGHKLNENFIGGYYNFGIVKLIGSWQDAKDQSVAGGNKAKLWNVGLDVPIGSGVIGLGYANKTVDGNSNRDAKSYSLGYVHKLSKRTYLYGAVNHTSNDALASYGDLAAAGIAAGADPTTYLLGIRHAF
ncbi:MAG: porin [Rhodocyclaceae bacterium]